jgi:hypothetical protein
MFGVDAEAAVTAPRGSLFRSRPDGRNLDKAVATPRPAFSVAVAYEVRIVTVFGKDAAGKK